MSTKRLALLLLGLSLLLFAAGCKKKVPAPPPPPPPPPPVVKEAPKPPVISSFTADPSSIERGSSSTLRWQVENATDVTIDQGIGTVPSNGSRQVFPNSNTTYTMTAKGKDGTTTRSVTVTVTAPPPPPPAPVKEKSLEEWVSQLEDALFDFDKSDIREDARAVLTRDADLLKTIFDKFPNATIVVEGHCDERGSAQYNLALGDRRATSAKDFLGQLGVPADKLRTISYGKEKPLCTESTEDCWQQNRRAHLSVGQ